MNNQFLVWLILSITATAVIWVLIRKFGKKKTDT